VHQIPRYDADISGRGTVGMLIPYRIMETGYKTEFQARSSLRVTEERDSKL